MLSRSSFALLVVVLSGCSGEESAPEPLPPNRPEFAGAYFINFRFDSLPSPVLGGDGMVGLGQPSQESPAPGGAIHLGATLGGQDYFPSWDAVGIISAQDSLRGVSISGSAVSFTLVTQGTTWTFTGTLTGKEGAGRLSITDGITTLSGDWSMYLAEIDGSKLTHSTTAGMCIGLLNDGMQFTSYNGTKADCLTFCPYCNFTYGTVDLGPLD